ncbi:hypothetical protein [Pseudoruegeria sp. SK021]|uniref:hypothetical protein n=1 Tax=Pseudoruegeria sp. SK021 TaxID=1933035 RepID=UPI00111C3EF4|nr:hypothetical protein [Pseudoruegeria sp. SK021]
MLRILLAALMSVAASAATADGSGEAILTIDGSSTELQVNSSQSDWTGSLQYASVSIWFAPKGGNGYKDVVSLSFDVQGSDAILEEIRAEVEGEKLFGNEDGGVRVVIEDISTDGESLKLIGRVEGRVGPSENYGRDIDLNAAIAVSGTFDVRLEPSN